MLVEYEHGDAAIVNKWSVKTDKILQSCIAMQVIVQRQEPISNRWRMLEKSKHYK